MPRGIPNKKLIEPAVSELSSPVIETEIKPEEWLATVKLLRHYRPVSRFEIIGHHTKAVMRKNAAGELYEAEPSVFVSGQKAPPPFPGVGFDSKIWAGTLIRLPMDEAKQICRSGIAEREFED